MDTSVLPVVHLVQLGFKRLQRVTHSEIRGYETGGSDWCFEVLSFSGFRFGLIDWITVKWGLFLTRAQHEYGYSDKPVLFVPARYGNMVSQPVTVGAVLILRNPCWRWVIWNNGSSKKFTLITSLRIWNWARMISIFNCSQDELPIFKMFSKLFPRGIFACAHFINKRVDH